MEEKASKTTNEHEGALHVGEVSSFFFYSFSPPTPSPLLAYILIIFVHGGFIAILFVVSFFCILRLQQSLCSKELRKKGWKKKTTDSSHDRHVCVLCGSFCFLFLLSFSLSFCTSFAPPPFTTLHASFSRITFQLLFRCLLVYLFTSFLFFFYSVSRMCGLYYLCLSTRGFFFWSKCYLRINARSRVCEDLRSTVSLFICFFFKPLFVFTFEKKK